MSNEKDGRKAREHKEKKGKKITHLRGILSPLDWSEWTMVSFRWTTESIQSYPSHGRKFAFRTLLTTPTHNNDREGKHADESRCGALVFVSSSCVSFVFLTFSGHRLSTISPHPAQISSFLLFHVVVLSCDIVPRSSLLALSTCDPISNTRFFSRHPLSIELSLTSKKKQNGTARQSDDGAIQHIKRSMIISLLLSRLLVNMVLPLLQSTLSSECLFHFQVGVGICRARCLLSTNMQDEMIVFEYMRERRFFFSGKTQCCHPLFYSLPVLC